MIKTGVLQHAFFLMLSIYTICIFFSFQRFGDEKYLAAAKDCGKVIWSRGLLKKGGFVSILYMKSILNIARIIVLAR